MKKYFKILLTVSLLTFFSFSYAETYLQPLMGDKVPFSSLQGKWVFINYWASWCGPCLEEIPVLNRFYERNKNNVALFAVNFESLSKEEQANLISHYKIRYPTLAEDPARSLKLGAIEGVPVTFVFNPEGELHDVLYGGQTLKSLQAALLL